MNKPYAVIFTDADGFYKKHLYASTKSDADDFAINMYPGEQGHVMEYHEFTIKYPHVNPKDVIDALAKDILFRYGTTIIKTNREIEHTTFGGVTTLYRSYQDVLTDWAEYALMVIADDPSAYEKDDVPILEYFNSFSSLDQRYHKTA